MPQRPCAWDNPWAASKAEGGAHPDRSGPGVHFGRLALSLSVSLVLIARGVVPMTEKPVPENPQRLECEQCLAEIPASVAHSYEGPDYVHHFCGLECFIRWQKQQQPESGD